MEKIAFSEFFKVGDPAGTKIKFNMNEGGNRDKTAWDNLKEDGERWANMNAWRTKQSSNNMDRVQYLLSFAQYTPYGPEFYIFGGMYRVTKRLPEVENGVGYDLELMDEYKKYRKRLIIRLSKPIGRDVYARWYENIEGQLSPEIYEILPPNGLEDFPGYHNVLLTHTQLQEIFRNEYMNWKTQLSAVKAVYCITDTSNGELYIGSASGDCEGLWQRWKAYADVNNLTGGNKTFEEIKNNGADHIIQNFTYSILEIFDMRTTRDEIVHREEHWKRVFQTVPFGMNNTR